jgi:hypothetical protein
VLTNSSTELPFIRDTCRTSLPSSYLLFISFPILLCHL